MMKPLAKQLYLALTAIVMIVCLSIGLAACKKNTPTALATPEGVKVTGNTLEWNEVDGAVEYTVKINDDETTVVFTTSLDLTTKKSLLKTGDNTLAVKANATDDRPASAYSEEVTYNYTTVFAAPTVTLNGSTISWNAATGAESYTVKINDDETTVVTQTTLDLTTTELLIKGNNTVSVKVNATAEKAGSEYSNTVTYQYVVDADEVATKFINAVNAIETATDKTAAIAKAKQAYKSVDDEVKAVAGVNEAIAKLQAADKAAYEALVNAIETVNENSTAEQLAAAKTAIAAAKEYKKTLVATDVAEANTKLEAGETAVAALEVKIEAYQTAVAAVEAAIEAKASATDLQDKIDAAEAAKVTACVEETAKLEAAKETLTAWNTAIEAAVAKLTVTATDDDEADIVSANAALANFDNYAAYVKEDSSVKAAKAATEAVLATAKENIEKVIDAIKTATEAVLVNVTPNETNYAALEAQKKAIEDVEGVYANEYLETLKIEDSGLLETVEKAMTTMLTTVVDSEGGEAYSLDGVTLKITLFRTFYNFKGQKIATTGSSAPEVTVTGNTVTVEQQFTKNDLNEYVAIINIENLVLMKESDASYTVTGSEATPLRFGETLPENPYFTPEDEVIDGTATGFKKAIANDHFNMTFQGGCTAEKYYLEVYNADAIIKDGNFVKFTAMPIGKIDVTGKSSMTIEQFHRFLLNSDIGELFLNTSMNVRFMIYGETVTEGVTAFTAMNASVISEAIKFNLTEEDKYYKLPVANINNSISTNDEGTMYLVVPDRNSEIINAVNACLSDAGVTNVTLDANNYTNYLQMKIEIYDADDLNETVLFTKYTDVTLMGTTVKNIIKEWQKQYFTENGNVEEPEYNIGIRISYSAKPETAITKYFPRANFAEAGITYNDDEGQVKYEKNVTLSKADLTIPNTGIQINGGNNAFEFLRDSVGSGKILTDGDALYLEIKFYLDVDGKETNVNYAYLYNVNDKAIIYNNKDISEATASQEVGGTGDSYIFFDNVKDFFKNNYSANGFPMRWDDGWTFTARYERNPDSETYLFDGDWSTPIVIPTAAKTDMPTHVQIGNDDNGNITFIRKPDGSQDGSVFTEGGAERIEYYFYNKDGNKSYEYCVFMKYDIKTKNAILCYNDGTEDVVLLDCKTATDSWCSGGDFVGALNKYLTAKRGEGNFEEITTETLNNWTFISKIIARDGNRIFNETEKESEGSWTYSYTPPAPASEE